MAVTIHVRAARARSTRSVAWKRISRRLADPAGTEPLWSGIKKKLKPLPKALEWHVYDPVMLAEVKAML